METYKFETTVLENGIIKIPEISKFANLPIEVSIVIKETNEEADSRKTKTTEKFLERWTGVLKGTDPDDAKYHIYVKNTNEHFD